MSFRLKTILGVALIEGALLLLLVWSSLQYVTASSGNELVLRASTIAESMGQLSADAILASDLARLDSVARQALESPDMVYVRFRRGNLTLAEAGPEDVLRRPFQSDADFSSVDDGILDVAFDMREGGFDVGRVELGLSVDRATLLINQARRYLSGIALGEMVLVALFSLLLGTYLTRGLDGLARAARAISQGDREARVEIKGKDELAETGRAFNDMSSRLAAAQRSMQRSVEESRALAVQLAEREMRLSTILNTAVDGFITIDERGHIDDLNAAAARLFGYAKAELVGQNVSCLMPEPDRSLHDGYISRYLESGEHKVIGHGRRVQGLRKDGSLFPMDLSVSEMSLEGRTLFVGLVRDLTEQLATELAARRNEIMRAAIVDANLDGLITVDRDDRVVEFSAVAEEMFGYSREDVIGHLMADLIIPPEMREMHRRGMQHYFETGEGPVLGSRIEVEAMRAGGGRFPVELAVQPIWIGEEAYFTAFVRDISERKAEEQALLEAKQKAEVASEAKSRFLAHMSHEIRSPLNAVLGSLELLLEGGLDERQGLYAQTAESSGKLLLGLINEILDFSKIEAGQMKLENNDFSLRQMVDEATHLVSQRAREKGLYLVAIVHPAVPDILTGDQPRMRQVLGNLLDNAVKFTAEGAVVLYVEPVQAGQQGALLRFTVEDSGIGIAPQAQAGLFDEFQQVDNSDATAYGGTGLGLAVCRGLVGLMGGAIGLNSKPGKGSSFWVEVPFAATPGSVPEVPPRDGMCSLIAVGLPPLLERILARFCAWNDCQLAIAAHPSDPVVLNAREGDVLLIGETLDSSAMATLLETTRQRGVSRCLLLVPGERERGDQAAVSGLCDSLIASPLNTQSLNAIIDPGQADTPSSTNREPVSAAAQQVGAGHRLLLAEDSPANQIVARAMLEGAGFAVDIANNGAQAIAAFEANRYHAILMDLRMPEVDGLQATEVIRALPGGQDVLIIALTANAMQEDVSRCLAAGMDDFIPKPVEKKRLLDTLDRHLAGTPSVDAGPDRPADRGDDQAPGLPLLDEQVIEQLSADVTPAAVPDMLRMFLKEVVQRADKVNEVLQGSAGLAVLEDEAHTLKSCAGTFGATRLQDLARDVEAACREGRTDSALSLGAGIDDVLHKTLNAYRERFDYLASSSDDANQITGQGKSDG